MWLYYPSVNHAESTDRILMKFGIDWVCIDGIDADEASSKPLAENKIKHK